MRKCRVWLWLCTISVVSYLGHGCIVSYVFCSFFGWAMNTFNMDGFSTTMDLFGVLVESSSFFFLFGVELQRYHKLFQLPFLYLYSMQNSISHVWYIFHKECKFVIVFPPGSVVVFGFWSCKIWYLNRVVNQYVWFPWCKVSWHQTEGKKKGHGHGHSICLQ